MPQRPALPSRARTSRPTRHYVARHASPPVQPERPASRRHNAVRVVAVAAAMLGAAAGGLTLAGSAAAYMHPAPHMPIGVLDSATHSGGARNTFVRMTGWAADPDDRSAPGTVLTIVDNHIVDSTRTNLALPVRGRAFHLGATPGFAITAAVPHNAPLPSGQSSHTVCAGVENTAGTGGITILGCTTSPWQRPSAALVAQRSPVGALTGSSGANGTLSMSGWATDPDVRFTRLQIALYVDGVATQTVTTGRSAASDVSDGAGPRGDFRFDVPISAGAHLGCVYAVNVGMGHNTPLGCRAVDTRHQARGTAPAEPAANRAVVTEALKHLGGDYVWGAEGPKVFDCSGLVMYSYGKAGMTTPRVAADQFHAAQLIRPSRAVPGDLVFYHDGEGSVYHVGIYLSPGRTVAAIDTAEGIDYQQIWTPSDATFGSFTHD